MNGTGEHARPHFPGQGTVTHLTAFMDSYCDSQAVLVPSRNNLPTV